MIRTLLAVAAAGTVLSAHAEAQRACIRVSTSDADSATFCPSGDEPATAGYGDYRVCPGYQLPNLAFVTNQSPGIRLEYSCDAHPSGQNPTRVNGEDCTGRGQVVRGFSINLAGPNAQDYVLEYECWSAASNICGPNLRHSGLLQAGEWCGDHFNSPRPWNQWWITRVMVHLRRR